MSTYIMKFTQPNQPLRLTTGAGETASRIELVLLRGNLDIWETRRDGSYMLLSSLRLAPNWIRETRAVFIAGEEAIEIGRLMCIGRGGTVVEVTITPAKISGN